MIDNKENILRVIFSRPEYHFHIREIAKLSFLHPNTAITATDALAKENIIIKQKHKHLVEVFANIESKEYKRAKQLHNIKEVYDSGLVDFLADFYHGPKAIVLFGSYCRGEDMSGSDIDIAVLSSEKKRPGLGAFEKKLKRKVHLAAFKREDATQEFYYNLINGFILYGYLSL